MSAESNGIAVRLEQRRQITEVKEERGLSGRHCHSRDRQIRRHRLGLEFHFGYVEIEVLTGPSSNGHFQFMSGCLSWSSGENPWAGQSHQYTDDGSSHNVLACTRRVLTEKRVDGSTWGTSTIRGLRSGCWIF